MLLTTSVTRYHFISCTLRQNGSNPFFDLPPRRRRSSHFWLLGIVLSFRTSMSYASISTPDNDDNTELLLIVLTSDSSSGSSELFGDCFFFLGCSINNLIAPSKCRKTSKFKRCDWISDERLLESEASQTLT